jgi:hypothetical protein
VGNLRLGIEIEGFRQLRAKLKADPPIYAKAWHDAAENIAQIGVRMVRARAPHGKTGLLQSSIKGWAQRQPVPSYVVLKNTARARGRLFKRQSKKARAGLAPLKYTKGYPYPGWLNYARAKGNRKGSPYLGWFTGAVKDALGAIDPALKEAARSIESAWKR